MLIIYAAVNEHLKDIPIEKIKSFEKQFLDFVGTQYPDIPKKIRELGEITDGMEQQIIAAIETFKSEFNRGF